MFPWLARSNRQPPLRPPHSPTPRRHLVIGIMLLGAAVRLGHLLVIDLHLPFHLGGLFAEFAAQIAAHRYALPTTIPFYTPGGIPFAYPPLPFYLEALLIDGLALPKFAVVNALPPLLSTLTLPAFHRLTGELGFNSAARLAALLVYAILPGAFLEHLEAAGLAEALGSLAIIVLAAGLARACREDSWRSHALAGLGLALGVLASPGSAYASGLMILIAAGARLARTARDRLAVALGGLALVLAVGAVVASPYWLAVISRHGVQVFWEPWAARHHAYWAETIWYAGGFRVSGIPSLYRLPWDGLLLAGLCYGLVRRRWALAAWLLAFLAVPQERGWITPIPAALLAGLALADLVGRRRNPSPGAGRRRRAIVLAGLAVLGGGYALAADILTIQGKLADANGILTADDMAAMEWARQTTPPDAAFVVLPFKAAIAEWTPHLARRTVLNMRYGAEWQPAENDRIEALNAALGQCEDLDCWRRSLRAFGYPGERVYLLLDRAHVPWLNPATSAEGGFEWLYENGKDFIGRLALEAPD